jgi:hypothetical protein
VLLCVFFVVYIGLENKFHLFWTTSRVNYKLSFAFETPEGVRSGQTVVRVYYEDLPPWDCWGPFPPTCRYVRLNGEAAAIRFPDGGAVAMLITPPFFPHSNVYSDVRNIADDLLTNDARIPFQHRAGWPAQYKYIDGHTGKFVHGGAEIPSDHMPYMIVFTNANDPHTARVFEPSQAEKWFGPNVKFLGARIDVVDDSVGSDVASILPWLRRAPSDGAAEPPPSPSTETFPCDLRSATTASDSFWGDTHRVLSHNDFCSRN